MTEKTMVEKLREFLDSPEGKKSTEDYILKLKKEEERIERWSMKVIRLIKDMSDDDLHNIFMKFLKWEYKYEDMWYSKGVCTNSRLFGIITKVVEKVGDEFESHEDFYSSGWTYRGYTFKIYCGQGCFTRIIYKNENIFQTT
jgi:hypothetical protein